MNKIKTGDKIQVPFVITKDLQECTARYHGKAVVELTRDDYIDFIYHAVANREADIIYTVQESGNILTAVALVIFGTAVVVSAYLVLTLGVGGILQVVDVLSSF